MILDIAEKRFGAGEWIYKFKSPKPLVFITYDKPSGFYSVYTLYIERYLFTKEHYYFKFNFDNYPRARKLLRDNLLDFIPYRIFKNWPHK